VPGAGGRYPPSQRPILSVVQKLRSRRGPTPRFHVDARFSTVIAPRREARHPVDRVHGSSVPRGEFRRFPHDLTMKLRSTATGGSPRHTRHDERPRGLGRWCLPVPSAAKQPVYPRAERDTTGNRRDPHADPQQEGTLRIRVGLAVASGHIYHRLTAAPPPFSSRIPNLPANQALERRCVRLLSALRWPAYERPVDGARPGGHGREAL